MNSAQSIVNRTAGASAVAYEGGYAVFADGSRVLFEPAHILRKRISLSGRCTALDCQYADGSYLFFRWHGERGVTIQVAQ